MERGEPLVNGPLWDFDRGFRVGATTGWLNHLKIWWYGKLWNYPEVQAMVKARWHELREPGQPFSDGELLTLARDLADEIDEVARRTAETYNPAGFQSFLTRRAAWVDAQWRPGIAPSVTDPADQVVRERWAVNLVVEANHPSPVVFDDRGTLPPGLEIDSASGRITGSVPLGNAGEFWSVITVSDASGASAVAEFKITVTSAGGLVAPLLLNEYNSVGASEWLDNEGTDSTFGRVSGNGGNWLELVVVQDHLDLRGWTIELWDKRSTEMPASASTLTLSDSPTLADLRAGTIITIGEALADDPSFAPAAGDWHLHFQANAAETGEYVSTGASGFDTNHEGMRALFRNRAGVQVGPAQGEVESSVADLGDRQVMAAAVTPTSGMALDVAEAYTATTSSTFGQANRFGLTVQDLDLIRPDDIAADGDVDGDGTASDADVQAILGALINMATGEYQAHRGDLDGDGTVTLADAQQLANCLEYPTASGCEAIAQ